MALGLIGTAIAGAMEGAGEAGVKAGLQEQQDIAEEQRAARLAEVQKELESIKSTLRTQEHAANVTADTAGKIEVAKASPRTIPAGSTEKTGENTFTAPFNPDESALKQADAKLKNAMADYYEGAKANEANARAAKLENGKAAEPKIIKVTSQDGDYLVDQNSGAVGVVIPGSPAKEAVWHLFGKNEPATPEVLAHTRWATPDGQPLKNGLLSLYRKSATTDQQSGGAIEGTTGNGARFSITQEAMDAAMQDPGKYKAMESAIGADRAKAIMDDWKKTRDLPNRGLVGSAMTTSTGGSDQTGLVGSAPATARTAQPGVKLPTPAEIDANPTLAQTTQSERARASGVLEQQRNDLRAALDRRIPMARTAQQKMQLFREFQSVMTPEERRKFASGRD